MICERTLALEDCWPACWPRPCCSSSPAGCGPFGGRPACHAGTLARGAGYWSQAGSQPVRELQRSLRRLGERPGPVDGLFGPLTEGAVERFQQAHGLATDGVVGPQTKTRLLAQGAKRPVADTSRPTHMGQLARKSPSGGNPAESATEQDPARSAPSVALSRAGPASSEGAPTELLALLAALASAALLLGLRTYGRRAREATVNFGMVCAALLATFVIGAATGAVFATQAAPDAGGEAFADSGALLAARGAPSHLRAREARELRRRGAGTSAGREAGAEGSPVRPARSRWRCGRAPGPPRRWTAAGSRRSELAPREPQAVVQRPRAAPRGVSEHVHRAAGRRALADRGAPPRTQQLGHGNRQAGPGSREPQPRPHRFGRPGPARGRRGTAAPVSALAEIGVGAALRRLQAAASLQTLFRDARSGAL